MSRERGFTLIEMMIAVAIMAVLAAVAIPNFQAMIGNNRLTTTSNQLVNTLAMARQEAITRSTDVEVAAIDGDWRKGWVVMAKKYKDDGTEDTGDTLATYEAIHAAIVVTGTPDSTDAPHPVEKPSSSAPASLQFNRQGRIALLDGAAIASVANISLCDARTNESGRTITLAPIGRVSVSPIICK